MGRRRRKGDGRRLLVGESPRSEIKSEERTFALNSFSFFFMPSNPLSARSMSSVICGPISEASERCAERTSVSVMVSKACSGQEVD
jgi:hypothetical protein